MLVVALVGILSAFALPTYQSALQRAQRAQARTLLMQAAHWLERAALGNGQYPSQLPAALSPTPGTHYLLQLSSTDTGFELRAQPVGAQASDPCGTLVLSHTGEKSVRLAQQSASSCWSR